MIKTVYKRVFDFLLGVNSPNFQNNFSTTLLVRFSTDSWDVKLWIVQCVSLQRIFKNGMNVVLRNLIINFGL